MTKALALSLFLFASTHAFAGDWKMLDSSTDTVVSMGCVTFNTSEDSQSAENKQIAESGKIKCQTIAAEMAKTQPVLAYRSSLTADSKRCGSSDGSAFASNCLIKLR